MLNTNDLIGLEISRTKNKNKTEDIYAYLLIQELIKFPEYFATTTSSLRFHTLAVILNDIIINQRKNIIEFGSGISTLAIANLIKKNNLQCNFISVEDNNEWFNYISSFLSRNGLQKNVKIIYAPLERNNLALENNLWYSMETINKALSNESKFNLVIIDGPGAWQPKLRLSRYTAVPFLINSLAEEFSIFLDDTNRKGEKEIMNLWHQKFDIKFEQINQTSAMCVKGNKFNTIP
jgi:hypothetical protein